MRVGRVGEYLLVLADGFLEQFCVVLTVSACQCQKEKAEGLRHAEEQKCLPAECWPELLKHRNRLFACNAVNGD